MPHNDLLANLRRRHKRIVLEIECEKREPHRCRDLLRALGKERREVEAIIRAYGIPLKVAA